MSMPVDDVDLEQSHRELSTEDSHYSVVSLLHPPDTLPVVHNRSYAPLPSWDHPLAIVASWAAFLLNCTCVPHLLKFDQRIAVDIRT
jgi:hypothetical protein